MKLASEMPHLLDDSNRNHSSDLSIGAALAYLSAPDEVKAEVDTKLEAGEKEFGFTRRHVNRLATSAEIELSLNLETLVSNPTESQLRPLSQIPAEECQGLYKGFMLADRERRRIRKCCVCVKAAFLCPSLTKTVAPA